MVPPIIKERLGVTGEESRCPDLQNLFLQYFPGLHEYLRAKQDIAVASINHG
ncbi:MAG: hypothetical protein HC767_01660 [Akkermansiaceae bacterium]|nr:hypothetical protein [Akkermansiaceae bacterium]